MEVVIFMVVLFIGIPIITVFFNKARGAVDSDFKERMDQANKINNMFPNMDTDVVIQHAKTQDLKLKEEQNLRKNIQKIKKQFPDLDEEALLGNIKTIQEAEHRKERQQKKRRNLEGLQREFPDMGQEIFLRHAETLDFLAEQDEKMDKILSGYKR